MRGIQRDPRYWRNPERFDPLRFSPQRAKGQHKFAYLPFLQGPRKCMGDAFALLEMKIVAATILTRFRFAYNQPDPPRERPSFVMETTDGVPLTGIAAVNSPWWHLIWGKGFWNFIFERLFP